MKIKLLLFSLLLLSFSSIKAQESRSSRIPLIGDYAPVFTAESTDGEINFPADFGNQWKVIFCHPRDFTPVCSTELFTLAQMQGEFKKLNTKIIVVSTDLLQKHFLWKKELESESYQNKKPVKINFPFVADPRWIISRQYGMIHKAASNTRDVRGVFIINPANKIAATLFYPMNIGRNMEEIKRTIIALQTSGNGKNSHLIPANWQPGDPFLSPYFPFTKEHADTDPEIKQALDQVAAFKLK